MESRKSRGLVAAFVAWGAFVMLAMSMMVSAAGLNDPIVGGITYMVALAILGFMVLIGAILWGARVPKAKNLGMGLTLVPMIVIFVMVVSMAFAAPAVVTPGPTPATYENLAVTVTHGNYTAATHTINVVLTVNSTAQTCNATATHLTVNVTVQRTDAGQSTDVKTITASYAPATVTDPISALSYSVAKPNGDGRPNVNWTLGGTTVATATRTLTAQMGMTPYQTGYMTIDITWNGAAFTTSNVAANDVINCGTITVGSVTYQVNALISAVWA